MQMQMSGRVESVIPYNIEGSNTKGLNIFLSVPNTGENENIFGNEILTISASYEQKDLWKKFHDLKQLPGEFELQVEMGRGSGGKAKLICKAARHLGGSAPTQREQSKT